MEYFSKYKDIKSIRKYGEEQTRHTLSIVIPTFNKPTALSRVVQSVLKQEKVKIDYNIVIIENYDEDVIDIISMLSAIDNPRNIQIVYYQNEKNIGMHPNWNRCVEIANADYVLMVHTDDYLFPNCVSCMENAIDSDLSAVIINRISVRSDELGDLKKIEHKISSIGTNPNFHKETYMDILIGTVPVAPTGLLIKKSIFIQYGGFNTKSHVWPADLEFCFKLVEGNKLYFYEKPLLSKTEGDGNDGSNIKITVPLIYNDKYIFDEIASKNHVLFKKQIVNMRLAAISKSFHIDYDQYISDLFPKYFLNMIWLCLYRVVRKIQYKIMLNR